MARPAGVVVPALVVLALLALTGCGTGTTPAPLAPAPASTTASVSSSATPTPSPSPTPAVTATPSVRPSPSASPSPTATVKPQPAGPLLVIDPGHSGRSIRSTDRRTGLRDIDYPNYPEIYEMFDVSTCVAQGLRTDGYRVTLTKKKALDSVGLAARARVANDLDAALAVSVHDDHSQTAGFQATYSQRGVKHGGAYHAMYRGTGAHRTVYANTASARAGERAAAIIARARTTAQGREVSVRENTFTGRPPLEPGNLALVQLLADVPWVYNEMGAKTARSTTRAMSIGSELGYARGLLVGMEAAVPLDSGVVAQPSAGAQGLEACLVRQVEPTKGTYTRPRTYLPYGF